MKELSRGKTRKKESGQATTEYVLLLFFVVFIFLIISRMLNPIIAQLADHIKTMFLQTFTKANMYQLPPGLRH